MGAQYILSYERNAAYVPGSLDTPESFDRNLLYGVYGPELPFVVFGSDTQFFSVESGPLPQELLGQLRASQVFERPSITEGWLQRVKTEGDA